MGYKSDRFSRTLGADRDGDSGLSPKSCQNEGEDKACVAELSLLLSKVSQSTRRVTSILQVDVFTVVEP